MKVGEKSTSLVIAGANFRVKSEVSSELIKTTQHVNTTVTIILFFPFRNIDGWSDALHSINC